MGMLIKVARLLGLMSAAGTLGLYAMLVWANPYSSGVLTLPIVLRMLVGLGGLWVAVKGQRYWMLLVFALSFVPLGMYMLRTPGLFRWIGILDLLYLVAGLLLFVKPETAKVVASSKPN
jgi:hypothetical protein